MHRRRRRRPRRHGRHNRAALAEAARPPVPTAPFAFHVLQACRSHAKGLTGGSAPTGGEMKIVGMYARVSSGRQEQERTIESQTEAIEQRVAEMGVTLDPEHRYLDDGWSGETLRRPALDQLRDAVAQERLDGV